MENPQATVIYQDLALDYCLNYYAFSRQLESMSQVILGAFKYLDFFIEKTFYFIYNGAGAEDNSSMLCDLLWNVEIALYCFLSECIKCL